jgi:hypothetical protein
MAYVERPRTNLEQQRRHQQEIIATDEHDLDILASSAKLLQVARGVDSTETTAKNHDSGLLDAGSCAHVFTFRV